MNTIVFWFGFEMQDLRNFANLIMVWQLFSIATKNVQHPK